MVVTLLGRAALVNTPVEDAALVSVDRSPPADQHER
jgi:hypothetical protein